MTAKQIGELIAKQRRQQGLTFRQIEKISGVCVKTISNVVNGKHETSLSNILAICAALDIEITFNVKPQTVEI